MCIRNSSLAIRQGPRTCNVANRRARTPWPPPATDTLLAVYFFIPSVRYKRL